MAVIVLIDDNADVRATMMTALTLAGHQVVEAANGVDGVAAVLKHSPDLVVVDMIMPEQDGLETLINLRAKHQTLPILAISGGGRTRNLNFLSMAGSLGATRLLAKPFGAAALLEAVTACLQGQ